MQHVLPVQHVRARVPVSEDGLGDDHPYEERECKGHAAARERVGPADVPRVAEEAHVFLSVRNTLLDGEKKRVGHAQEMVFRSVG
jgi:hypothetical protein